MSKKIVSSTDGRKEPRYTGPRAKRYDAEDLRAPLCDLARKRFHNALGIDWSDLESVILGDLQRAREAAQQQSASQQLARDLTRSAGTLPERMIDPTIDLIISAESEKGIPTSDRSLVVRVCDLRELSDAELVDVATAVSILLLDRREVYRPITPSEAYDLERHTIARLVSRWRVGDRLEVFSRDLPSVVLAHRVLAEV